MPWIYHEKQDAGLCGVHCLNNLLQGRFVTELDLMTYARRLDEAERHIMGEMGTETSDYLKFIAVSFVLVRLSKKIIVLLRQMCFV